MTRATVLVSNDDGINAPGLQALVAELVSQNFCGVFVCAPSGERSAQSHAITLGRYLSCYRSEVPGAVEAFAVDGTPADAVMLALNGPVFKVRNWDLIVSGINRGDNMGMHVIYSGTVGAAREAAAKGGVSMAFSLDNHKARSKEDYAAAAVFAVALIKASLGYAPPCRACTSTLSNCVFNVNVPKGDFKDIKGFYMTHQGVAGVFPDFQEVTDKPGPHLAEIEEHTPDIRVFRNYAGEQIEDDEVGSDSWAVAQGYVSVTPLGLRSDIGPLQANIDDWGMQTLATTCDVVHAAGTLIGKKSSTLAKMLKPGYLGAETMDRLMASMQSWASRRESRTSHSSVTSL